MEIRLSEHAKLQVDITQEMIQDYAECGKLSEIVGGDGKDCGKCSLNVDVFGNALCEIPVITDILRARAGRMQGGKEDV